MKSESIEKTFTEDFHGNRSNRTRSKLLSHHSEKGKVNIWDYKALPLLLWLVFSLATNDANAQQQNQRILTYINAKGLEWISRARSTLFFPSRSLPITLIICCNKLLFCGFCVCGGDFCDLNCQCSLGWLLNVDACRGEKEGRRKKNFGFKAEGETDGSNGIIGRTNGTRRKFQIFYYVSLVFCFRSFVRSPLTLFLLWVHLSMIVRYGRMNVKFKLIPVEFVSSIRKVS